MTIVHNEFESRRRPTWMPHPGLLALIAVLWALAGAVNAVTLGH